MMGTISRAEHEMLSGVRTRDVDLVPVICHTATWEPAAWFPTGSSFLLMIDVMIFR